MHSIYANKHWSQISAAPFILTKNKIRPLIDTPMQYAPPLKMWRLLEV